MEDVVLRKVLIDLFIDNSLQDFTERGKNADRTVDKESDTVLQCVIPSESDLILGLLYRTKSKILPSLP